ncbi:hypothetical protein ACF8PD_18180 [Vibrio plantisponsor]|uniref:hypothetical protein n=1 Tax=Vibrio plantisponsor TaxID=664643 RepID=UPI00370B38EA
MKDFNTKAADVAPVLQKKSHSSTSKARGDISEKQKSEILRSALAISALEAIDKKNCLIGSNSIDPTITKKGIHPNSEVQFKNWKKADRYQRGLIYGLRILLNAEISKSDDVVLPFTVRTLRENKAFFDATDTELASMFRDHLKKGLRTELHISEPEFFFIITGMGDKRHIHGCIRVPSSQYDDEQLTATKQVHDVLKRACGLTDRLRDNIASQYNTNRELYRFAIASPNPNGNSRFDEQGREQANPHRPYGHMVYIDPPSKAGFMQDNWMSYILSERNHSNNIYGTQTLKGQSEELNGRLHDVLKELRSCSDWTDNKPKFYQITDAWAEVLNDCMDSSSNVQEHTAEDKPKTTSRSDCEGIGDTTSQSKVLEKNGLPRGDKREARDAILKIGSRKLKDVLSEHERNKQKHS